MISSCGVWISIRRPKEQCPKCLGGRLKNCPCPGCEKGIHWLPGAQKHQGNGRTGMRRLIDASARTHREMA